MLVLGIDLAWGEGTATAPANETGVVAATPDGRIIDAGWTVGVDATIEWIERLTGSDDALVFIDAPLMVRNPNGQRQCEREVGQRYGKWKVSANSTNLASKHLGGVELRRRLETLGWAYDDGRGGPPTTGRHLSECYPYTTLVGAAELGYDDARPVYKRKPKKLPVAEFRAQRAAVCDDMIQRIDTDLRIADPPLLLGSHPTTALLASVGSPLIDKAYKTREDLLDAVVCAWTGLLWLRWGFERCQVLGADDADTSPVATIIAPYRPEQRPQLTAS